MSFAHGSNDVANAIGSFAAAYYVYSTGSVPGNNVPIYPWILAIGGTGIVVGLATYGECNIELQGQPVACGMHYSVYVGQPAPDTRRHAQSNTQYLG